MKVLEAGTAKIENKKYAPNILNPCTFIYFLYFTDIFLTCCVMIYIGNVNLNIYQVHLLVNYYYSQFIEKKRQTKNGMDVYGIFRFYQTLLRQHFAIDM